MVFWSRAGWAKAWRLGSQQLSEVEGRRRMLGGQQAHHGKPGSWGLRKAQVLGAGTVSLTSPLPAPPPPQPRPCMQQELSIC